MIKKIILLLILSCLFISCGKKGDPIYKASKEKNKFLIISINKI